jgi:hypothetical protein
VAGGLYYLLSRSINVNAERRLAEREQTELEERADEHAVPAASG